MPVSDWVIASSEFRCLLQTGGLCDESIRWMLRGLTLSASEAARQAPEEAHEILRELHGCLALVQDRGQAFHFEAWLRSHASAEIAEAVEHEFPTPRS
jgi:hypothetical protein